MDMADEALDGATVDAYLARLGMARPLPTTYETLATLVQRHTAAVPFENVDVFRRQPIALGARRAADKIIRRRQGGFCFELNEALRALLVALGYRVRRLEARVWSEPDRRFGAPFDHLVLAVGLPDGEYLVDVGFGDNNRRPIRLPADETRDISGAYRLRTEDDEFLRLERLGESGTPRPLYRLSLESRPLSAFAAMCKFHQTDPTSIFMRGLVCTRSTSDGRVTLTHDRLITVADGTRHEEALTATADLGRLLEAHFGIPARA